MGTVGPNIEITHPTGPQDFTQPFSIRWRGVGAGVTRWWLCAGTSDGEWDVLSADMGTKLRAAIDVSDLSSDVKKLYVRLVYSRLNSSREEDDNFMTLPFEINRL